MALDAAHRSSIYTKLVPILGEDDANVLMSEFPSIEADELVTKQFLRAELAALEAKLTGQITDLDAKVTGQITDLDAKLTGQITDLDAKLTGQITGFDTKLSGFDTKLAALETRLTMRIGAAFGACTAILAALNLLS